MKVLEDEYDVVRTQKISPAEKRRLRNKKTALKARIKEKEKMQGLEFFKQGQSAKCEEFLSILMETIQPSQMMDINQKMAERLNGECDMTKPVG